MSTSSARPFHHCDSSARTTFSALMLVAPLVGAAVLVPSTSRADNPIVQTLYTADPAPVVYNETVYVFTGHDEDVLVNNFFTMNDWRVYSSKDMANWTDHGSPLSYKTFSWSSGDAWAGQVIARNNKFYYYVPTNRNGGKVIAVAVADNIIGPYKDALGKPLVTSDCGDIDPTVFIDDDGQAYLYWGNPNLCYVKLNSDMTSYTGSVVKVPMTTASFGVRSKTDRPTTYEEGPWFYKRDGRYYMVFAAGPISEHIGYATSTGPTGPWVYGGVVMPTEGASFTNHPGVVDFKGKSYFFYHNGALPGGGGYHRSVAVEEFTYGTDGKIPQIKMSTAGPAPVAALNPYNLNEAETIAWESGIETEVCSEGGIDVTAISSGDYIKVKNVDFGSGATSLTARVAAAAAGGSIQIRLGSQTGTLVGTCTVAATGGNQTWANTTCTISGASGVKDLFFVFAGSGTFNFNSWQFSGTGGASTGGAGGGPATGGAPSAGGSTTTGGVASAGGSPSTGGTKAAGGGNATGGAVAVGGAVSSGGSKATGGATTTATTGGATAISTTGGSTSTGGTPSVSGGASQTGGAASSTGGAASTNPNGSGGAIAVGGSSATGGSMATGAAAATGGTVGAITDGGEAAGNGCGCRVAGPSSDSKTGVFLGALVALALQSIRRRSLRTRQRC